MIAQTEERIRHYIALLEAMILPTHYLTHFERFGMLAEIRMLKWVLGELPDPATLAEPLDEIRYRSATLCNLPPDEIRKLRQSYAMAECQLIIAQAFGAGTIFTVETPPNFHGQARECPGAAPDAAGRPKPPPEGPRAS